MKKSLIVISLFLFSCSGIKEFSNKIDFRSMLEDYTFDSKLYSIKSKDIRISPDDVKLIKVEDIKNLPETLTKVALELEGYGIVHEVKFSTDQDFFVYRDVLKDYGSSKGSNVIVYMEMDNVLKYSFYRKNFKIKTKKGYKLFNAFLFSKIEPEGTYNINID